MLNFRTMLYQNLRYFLPLIISILLTGAGVFAQKDDQPRPRDIVPVFEKERPASSTKSGGTPRNNKRKKKVYKRISARPDSGRIKSGDRPDRPRPKVKPQPDIAEAKAQQIGFTLWHLLEVRPDPALETFEIEVSGRKRYLLPERVSTDTVFDPYERVRFSVESSRPGYLYILDQEMYADGTLGEAKMVFPNLRIRDGANRVTPGSPVELPDLGGTPFYFELRPNNRDEKALTAELLTVIITDRPITHLTINDRPKPISDAIMEDWRAKWAGRTEIFEASDHDGINYTREEREAAGGARALTAEDPLPGTVFLVEGNPNGGSLITVPLWYKNP